VDADSRAFEGILEARGLPKTTDEEKQVRNEAMQRATRRAIEIPYRVMQIAFKSMDVIEAMAREGNPNSKSDAGVGAICARSAVLGAWLNVRINAMGSENDRHLAEVLAEGEKIRSLALEKEKKILDLVGLN